MTTDSPCIGYVCFACAAQPQPGCASCVDGIDWRHVEACATCRDRVPAIVGGGAA